MHEMVRVRTWRGGFKPIYTPPLITFGNGLRLTLVCLLHIDVYCELGCESYFFHTGSFADNMEA
jgi:hypothetical protein